MSNSTPIYDQLFNFLRQYSQSKDLRHLKALAWMVNALICSGQLRLKCLGALCYQSGAKSPERGATLAKVFGEC
jgi:hypothetical protein